MKTNGNHALRQRQIATTTRLSCEACTRRKVKCDKTIPCTNCQSSGILCVPVERKRLPRGRSRRLENWPAQVPWDSGYYDTNDMTAEASPTPENPSPSQSLSQPIFNGLSVSRGLDSHFPQKPHRWDTTTYNFCNTAPRCINSGCNITVSLCFLALSP